jgi:hypothetical protein
MKPVLFLAILILTTCCSSCELLFPKTEPKTELEKLPPITQEGKNTFGCLVNGKAFVVTNSYNQVAIYEIGMLQFGASIDDGDLDESIYMVVGDPLVENEVYSFIDARHNAEYQYRNTDNICIYEFENTYNGKLSFSKIDRNNYIISGTFEFSTVIRGCDTIRITEGRFDMQYNP